MGLHLRTKAEVESDTLEQTTTGHSTVLGFDLGVNHPAVTSTGTFWSGHEFDHWRREYEKRRASLQQCGSRHAHENIQSVGRKETGRFELILHQIANGIIEEAAENGRTVIRLRGVDRTRTEDMNLLPGIPARAGVHAKAPPSTKRTAKP